MNTFQLPGLTIEQSAEILPPHILLLGYVGSTAHGTYAPKSDPNAIDDIDVMGVCMAPESSYHGLKHFEHKCVQKGEWDAVTYEVRKFVKLLLHQNPNVLGMLWLRPQDYLLITESGQLLIDNRNLFSSKMAYSSFVGYAHGQFHKMTHNACEGYMGKKRKELVEQFGFDCKNAAHLLRILRQGIEFLETGVINVFRTDAEELIDVKQGKWTLEQVKDEAVRLFNLAAVARENSTLPEKPDAEAAEELLMQIVRTELKRVY